VTEGFFAFVGARPSAGRLLAPEGYLAGDAVHTLAVAGRLRPGATLEDANREAAVVAERRARAFPDAYVRRDGSITTLRIVSLQEATVGRAREGLSLLFGAVTLLLLVACANVARGPPPARRGQNPPASSRGPPRALSSASRCSASARTPSGAPR
jgi:hypothetical protein